MSAYVDTSVVTKWYIPEPLTPSALAIREQLAPPVLLSPLLRAELVNAWHLKVFRGDLGQEIVTQLLNDFEEDVRAGVYTTAPAEPFDVFLRAEALSAAHSSALGTRTLDVLHVAWALASGADAFITHDARQASLASEAGLTLIRLV